MAQMLRSHVLGIRARGGGCHLSLSPMGAGHTSANHANGCSRPFLARPWLRAAPAEEGHS